MISFNDKTILVVETNLEIGNKIATQLNGLGARVVLVTEDKTKLHECITAIGTKKHKYFHYNLNNINEAEKLIKSLVEHNDIKFDGYVHCLTNIQILYPKENMSFKKFFELTKAHSNYFVEILKRLNQELLIKRGASVVFLSSSYSRLQNKNKSTYISSKVPLINIFKELSLEYIEEGIRVNNLQLDGILEPSLVNKASNFSIFLLSSSAKYIIGETYCIGE